MKSNATGSISLCTERSCSKRAAKRGRRRKAPSLEGQYAQSDNSRREPTRLRRTPVVSFLLPPQLGALSRGRLFLRPAHRGKQGKRLRIPIKVRPALTRRA